jgi:hypothetical protein
MFGVEKKIGRCTKMSKTIKKYKDEIEFLDIYQSVRRTGNKKPTMKHEDMRYKKKFKQKMKYFDLE